MAVKSWTLSDRESGTYVEEFTTSDLGAICREAEGCSIDKRTLRGGLSEGVEVVRINNGRTSIDVLPTRGMSLWKAWLGDWEIGWRSPVRGPVHPSFVPVGESSGLGWLNGFDELLVRCGLESNGAPDFDEKGKVLYPLHGRIANLPATRVQAAVDDETGELSVRGVVEEVRFHFQKLRLTTTVRMSPGEAGCRIHDVIENISASPAGAQMLYHVNFGDPLLDAGSRFVAPLKTVVPRNDRAAAGIAAWDNYQAPVAGFEEQVYFMELAADADGQTMALLKNAHGTRGASLHFAKKQLPCFTVWKNTTSLADGYVTGLEPGTNFPNPRSYEAEQRRVVKLSPGGKVAFELALQFHDTPERVGRVEALIAAIQSQATPQILKRPQPGWCSP